MARSKMEKQFSEQLNQREIRPAADSWNRLDAMLNASAQKKSASKKWYLIAASILVLVTISTFFFRNENVIPNQQVVQQQIQTEQQIPQTPTQIAPISQNTSVEVAVVKQKKTQKQNNSIQSSINQQQVAQNPIQQNQNQNVAQNGTSQNVSTNAVLNDSRTNELLAEAQTKMQSQAKSISVNAKNLLSQVDEVENQTFRQKLFKSVGKNYQNVKVALANRNIDDENQ